MSKKWGGGGGGGQLPPFSYTTVYLHTFQSYPLLCSGSYGGSDSLQDTRVLTRIHFQCEHPQPGLTQPTSIGGLDSIGGLELGLRSEAG